eukprot:s447_g14.t1
MGKRAGHREWQQRIEAQLPAQLPETTNAEQQTEDDGDDSDPASSSTSIGTLRERGLMPDPAYRLDAQRMTPAQIRHCLAYGLQVLSDEEVNRRRNAFRESIHPSIEEYLPDEVLQRIQRGEDVRVAIPINPAEWQGIGRQQRDAILNAMEDALLLGIEYEEMNASAASFARRLRAELETTRVVGEEILTQTYGRALLGKGMALGGLTAIV